MRRSTWTSSAWPPARRFASRCRCMFDNEGLSPGLKRGGVLNIVRHAVECYCDPDHVPAHFVADLGALDINDNVRWSRPEGHRGHPAHHHRARLRDRHGGAAHQGHRGGGGETRRGGGTDGGRGSRDGGAGGGGGAATPVKAAGRPKARRRGSRPGMLPCCSGSASAIRSRAWPGTGTISASWRWT